MGEFKIQSKFKPTGDQPKAIDTCLLYTSYSKYIDHLKMKPYPL